MVSSPKSPGRLQTLLPSLGRYLIIDGHQPSHSCSLFTNYAVDSTVRGHVRVFRREGGASAKAAVPQCETGWCLLRAPALFLPCNRSSKFLALRRKADSERQDCSQRSRSFPSTECYLSLICVAHVVVNSSGGTSCTPAQSNSAASIQILL